MKPTVQHDPAHHRFFIKLPEGECELKYRKVDDDTLDYYHTFVPPELRNRGLAAVLVEYALNYARTHNYQVIPSCPYVNSYIARNQ